MKSNEEHKELFDTGGCLSQLAIEQYIDGLLDESAMKIGRLHAQECELCSDALDGARHISSGQKYNQILAQMHQSAWKKSLSTETKSPKLIYILSSAAASIIVITGIFYLYRLKNNSNINYKANTEIAYSASKTTTQAEEIGTLSNLPIVPPNDYIQTPEVADKPNMNQRKGTIDLPQVKLEQQKLDKISSASEQITVEETSAGISEEMVKEDVESEDVKQYALKKTMADESAPSASNFGLSSNAPVSEVLKEENKSPSLAKRTSKAAVSEELPQFRGGGVDNFKKYVADTLKKIIPATLNVKKIEVGFTINVKGNLEKVKLNTGTKSNETNNKILKIIKNSPAWTPKKINGVPVASEQLIQILFD